MRTNVNNFSNMTHRGKSAKIVNTKINFIYIYFEDPVRTAQ